MTVRRRLGAVVLIVVGLTALVPALVLLTQAPDAGTTVRLVALGLGVLVESADADSTSWLLVPGPVLGGALLLSGLVALLTDGLRGHRR